MATTEQLAQAEAEFERANQALNDARTAVIRAERRLNLARDAGADVDPGLLAQATQDLDTARSTFQAADAAYTAAQQNLQTVFDAVDDTAGSQADPAVRLVESEFQASSTASIPLSEVNTGAQPQTDPAEIPGVTVFGASLATDTGGVPTEALAGTPVPTPVIEDDIEGGAVGFPEDEFAGNGYGFTYDEDGELIPFDPEADQVESNNTATEDQFAGDGYGFVYDEDGNLIPADSADAERIANAAPEAPVNYSVTFEDGFDWVIIDDDTGSFVETGFATQQEARAALAALTGEAIGFQGEVTADDIAEFPNADAQGAATVQAATAQARSQQTIEAQRAQANQGDWRVKLRLAGGANYLYRDPAINQDGILYPLALTDGVIFPYTPTITTAYSANYNSYDLTHSNYRGYFYQNSFVDEINIQAVFTAQDTAEANYMLAVIHFFRSVTKMFYGQDTNRGLPPPLVFLQGLGEFQFNLHPCVVRSFNYNLPSDVDYIRARTVTVNGTNLLQRRGREFLPTNTNVFSAARLTNSNLSPGAETARPAPPTLGTNKPTYVPTRLEMTVMLLPVQTREQVSKQFSVKQYANGDLIKGGFW